MTAKRYRAHRALASVVLGWVAFRVIAYQCASPDGLPVTAALPMRLPKITVVVREPALTRSILVRAVGLRGASEARLASAAHGSQIVPVLASPNLRNAPLAIAREITVSAADSINHSMGEFVAKPDAPSSSSRLNLYSWVFVRQHSPSANFVPEGQLGGSQFGIRALYRLGINSAESIVSLSARVTRPLALNSGAEAGLGLELHPIKSLPINLIVERRIRLESGGRSAWASFVAGGFYHQLPNTAWIAEGYSQAGIVGAQQRDAFIDGAIGLSHPIGPDPNLKLGVSAWGGIQPGVKRLDIGPRLKGVLHTGALPIHWELSGRVQVVGTVRPASGVALTISSGL